MTLSVLDSIVLSIAFAASLLVVSTATARGTNMRYTRGILQSVVMVGLQCMCFYAGVWVTSLFNIGELTYDKWLTSGVLIIVAIKLAVNAIKKQGVRDAIYVPDFKSILFLGVAASMDAFIIGMGIGFTFDTSCLKLTMILTLVLGFVASIVGIFVGRQKAKMPARLLVGAEAMLFVELAIKLFFE